MRPTVFLPAVFALVFYHAAAQIVYPGDTNNDGTANQYDLLPIGIAYGLVGPPRFFPTPEWSPQQAQPWAPQVLPVSMIDLAFVDGNGNGKIDSLDIGLIIHNYDSTQNNAVPPPLPYQELLTQFCFSCPQPEIAVAFDQDTVGGLDTFSAIFSLRYPPGVPPLLGALGIAFDVEYDYNPDLIVDSLTRVYPDTIPDTRMYVVATHTNALSSGFLPPAGRIGFAAAGRGANVFFASVPLFTAEFIISDMIILKGDATELFTFKISDILIINKQEQIIGLGGIQMDSVVVLATEPAARQLYVQLSPNPVHDVLSLESPDAPMEEIEIRSLAGERVLRAITDKQRHFELPVASLPPGLWLALVRTDRGTAAKKFVKME